LWSQHCSLTHKTVDRNAYFLIIHFASQNIFILDDLILIENQLFWIS
jgi:hypothetical protein